MISSGGFHTCALLTTGAMGCWGLGSFGQLGHDSTASVGDAPARSVIAAGDVPVGETVSQIAAGGGLFTCALLTTGAVRCWGTGADGRLGYNSTANVGATVGQSIIAAGDVPIQ